MVDHPHFDPSQHPRGPNGRFTESFARALSAGDRKKAAAVTSRHRPRKDLGTPDASATYLRGLSGDKPNPAAGTFMGDGFKEVNPALRAGSADGPGVAALDKAMTPLPDDLTVWRHIPSAQFGHVDPKSLAGMHVRDAGFFPTTMAPPKRDPDGGGVRMQVLVPSGTKGASAPDQYGLVLDRGLDMAVTQVADSPGGGLDMTVAVLTDPTGGAPASPALSAPAEPAEPARTEPARTAGPRPTLTGRDARTAAGGSLVNPDGPPPLTDEQQAGLEAYLDESYQPINDLLRGGDPVGLRRFYTDEATVRDWVANIDSAMDQSRLPEQVRAWRGISSGDVIFGDQLNSDLTGAEWVEDAYVSTSTEQSVSERFAGAGAGSVLMRVTVPPGVGAVELSDESYEAELMLQRGLRMRVTADHGVGPDGRRVLDVEVVPADG